MATPVLVPDARGQDELAVRRRISDRLSILVDQVPHFARAKWSGSATFAFALGHTLPSYQSVHGTAVGWAMFWAW